MTKKVAIRLQRGAPIQLPSAAKFILFLKNCTPPMDLVHFKHKIIANGDGGNDGDGGDDDARPIKGLRALEKVSQGDPIQPARLRRGKDAVAEVCGAPLLSCYSGVE